MRYYRISSPTSGNSGGCAGGWLAAWGD